jgi:hypothetical protein
LVCSLLPILFFFQYFASEHHFNVVTKVVIICDKNSLEFCDLSRKIGSRE